MPACAAPTLRSRTPPKSFAERARATRDARECLVVAQNQNAGNEGWWLSKSFRPGSLSLRPLATLALTLPEAFRPHLRPATAPGQFSSCKGFCGGAAARAESESTGVLVVLTYTCSPPGRGIQVSTVTSTTIVAQASKLLRLVVAANHHDFANH
eukprot:777263-Rhodomonas_salina.1